MPWDSDKSTASDPDNPSADEQLTATEWDNHVADQKGHASRHEQGGSDEMDVDTAQITAFAENVEDTVNGLLSGGTNISLTYDDANDTLTVDTSALNEEEVEDAVAALITTDAGLTFNYDDANDTITLGLAAHATRHENGGSDEINVGGLSGDLADAQDPKTHVTSHHQDAADEAIVENLGATSTDTNQFFGPDGSGGVRSTTPPVAVVSLIESQSPSGVSTAGFTTGIDSDHAHYEFRISGLVPATDGVHPTVQFSTDGGSTWETGASAYRYSTGLEFEGSSSSSGSSGRSDIPLYGHGFTQQLGSAAGEGGGWTVTLVNPSDSNLFTKLYYSGAVTRDDNSVAEMHGAGQHSTATAIDGVRFQFSSGNIESGTIELYGYN